MDYIFYRIYLYYKKKEYIPIMGGIYFIFVLQVSIVFFLGIVFNHYLKSFAEKDNKTTLYVIFFIIFLFLFVIDVVRYGGKKKVQRITERFQDNSLNDKIKTWQIFILPICIVFLAVGIIILFLR